MEWKRWKLTQKAMAFRILYLSGSNMRLFIEVIPSSVSDLTPDVDLLKSIFCRDLSLRPPASPANST